MSVQRLMAIEERKKAIEERQIEMERRFYNDFEYHYRSSPVVHIREEDKPKTVEEKFIRFAHGMLDFSLMSNELDYMRNMTKGNDVQVEWEKLSLETKINVYNQSIKFNPNDWWFLDVGPIISLMEDI